MGSRRPEAADVLREHSAEFLKRQRRSVGQDERRVIRDLIRCRTPELGGHKRRCGKCGHEKISYNSCRNRHCPKCQASARAEWLEKEAAHLLDVEYFHVVFTIPRELNPLALSNKRALYGALFAASSQTLKTIARDPKHLGAEIGFLSVLHTWGQNLQFHPHVHCVVPGGGISPDGSRWVACRKRFFLPVRVLSRLFRRRFTERLDVLYASGKLRLEGPLAHLKNPAAWAAFLQCLRKKDWVVYSKPPFGGPAHVLKYLARYTHRVAISNRRLLSLSDDGQVSFRWKDYANGNRKRVMTLDAGEFIRRFLLHVLPRGFVRIRHYGFLSNRSRSEKLARIRGLLGDLPAEEDAPTTASPRVIIEPVECLTTKTHDTQPCPRCGTKGFAIVERFSAPALQELEAVSVDTS